MQSGTIRFVITGIMVALLATSKLSQASARENHQNPNVAGNQHPNVVIILADDQGWGDLSLNGNRNLSTPNIDSLAADGVQFDQFYVSRVCSPTRASLLTGRYFERTGVTATSSGLERINEDEYTIGKVFHEAGYATGCFGKWHNGTQYPLHPNAQGFEEFYGFTSGHWGNYYSPMLDHNGTFVTGNGYIIDDLTEQAMKFMESQAQEGRPFFTYVPYCTPHSPMQVPDRFWNRFAGKELPMLNRDAKSTSDHTRAAMAMCENIDWNVGRILEKLKQLEIEENTIVIYFSDNGPNGVRWNGDMLGRKGSIDEGGVRSPLLIRWPDKIPAGKRVRHVAAAFDLLPTLSDLAGIPRREPKPVDGVSLKPLLLGEEEAWPARVIFSSKNQEVSARTDRFRLASNGKLFEMSKDPGQRHDVSKDYPEVCDELKQAVADWKRSVWPNGSEATPRPFTVGYPGSSTTQLPIRDATSTGNIERSNRFPNCSYFTNWTSTEDRIQWDVDVVESGPYQAEIYYTCAAENVGSNIELALNNNRLQYRVVTPHDPPIRGAEHDRIPRAESYVKDFLRQDIGTIELKAGRGQLSLRALEVAGTKVMDVRLLILKKLPR